MPKMNQLYLPVSLIDTRDCFVFDAIIDIETVNMGPGREAIVKKTFYFDPDVVPDNYDKYLDQELIKKGSENSIFNKHFRSFVAQKLQELPYGMHDL